MPRVAVALAAMFIATGTIALGSAWTVALSGGSHGEAQSLTAPVAPTSPTAVRDLWLDDGVRGVLHHARERCEDEPVHVREPVGGYVLLQGHRDHRVQLDQRQVRRHVTASDRLDIVAAVSVALPLACAGPTAGGASPSLASWWPIFERVRWEREPVACSAHAELTVLPEWGHFLQEDARDTAGNLLAGFLRPETLLPVIFPVVRA